MKRYRTIITVTGSFPTKHLAKAVLRLVQQSFVAELTTKPLATGALQVIRPEVTVGEVEEVIE